MGIISTTALTKDYGKGKGIFDVSIDVAQGEVFGFLGPNGAGKTTTIRNLMGFIKPEKGSCTILGMDCFKEAAKIQREVGYLAGEIAFLDDMSGKQLIQFVAELKGVTDRTRIQELMDRFELDPRGKVKKMSKGMKQKISIIAAFMNDPKVILLDEPTSGLDPLMQNRFIELVLEEKKKGKTILLSSHIFEEVERTCDRTAIIRDGKIAAIEDMESLAKKKKKIYEVTFVNENDIAKIKKTDLKIVGEHGKTLEIERPADLNQFLTQLIQYPLREMNIHTQTLEEIFLHFYGKGDK